MRLLLLLQVLLGLSAVAFARRDVSDFQWWPLYFRFLASMNSGLPPSEHVWMREVKDTTCSVDTGVCTLVVRLSTLGDTAPPFRKFRVRAPVDLINFGSSAIWSREARHLRLHKAVVEVEDVGVVTPAVPFKAARSHSAIAAIPTLPSGPLSNGTASIPLLYALAAQTVCTKNNDTGLCERGSVVPDPGKTVGSHTQPNP
jgi:hypothetical protein